MIWVNENFARKQNTEKLTELLWSSKYFLTAELKKLNNEHKIQWNEMHCVEGSRVCNICWKHNSMHDVERSKTPSMFKMCLIESTHSHIKHFNNLCGISATAAVRLGKVSKFRKLPWKFVMKMKFSFSPCRVLITAEVEVQSSSWKLQRQLACPEFPSTVSQCVGFFHSNVAFWYESELHVDALPMCVGASDMKTLFIEIN